MKKVLLLLVSALSLSVIAVNAQNANQIFFQLNSKLTTDSAYQSSFNSADYCKVVFDSTFDSNVDGPEDQGLPPFGMGGEQLTILQTATNAYLSIEGRQLPTTSDTIQLDFQSPSALDYQLQIDPSQFVGNGVKAYLYDNYLQKDTVLADTILLYDFVPDVTNAATYQDRFSIIFKSSTLPISSISLSAILKNATVALNWKTIGESNVESYGIEKSTDGVTFHQIGTVTARNTSIATYAYTDVDVLNGNNYYRIKAVSKNGGFTYSAVSVVAKQGAGVVSIYPNPIKNNLVNIKFNEVSAGKYIMSVINVLGQRVYSKEIQHNGGTAAYNTSLDGNVANGIYKISIISATTGKSVYETSAVIAK